MPEICFIRKIWHKEVFFLTKKMQLDLGDERLKSSIVDPFSVLLSMTNILRIHVYPVIYLTCQLLSFVIINHYYWFCNRTELDTYYWIQLMYRMSGDTCFSSAKDFTNQGLQSVIIIFKPCTSPFSVFIFN